MKKLFLGFIALSIMSCNFHEKRKNDAAEALKKADESLVSNHPDTTAMSKARVAVRSFIQRFPEDTLSPAYLYQLAVLYEKQGKYDSSMKMLNRIYSQYQHTKYASKALFSEGYLLANTLKQYAKAKEKYELYLQEYSTVDTSITNMVKFELQNLGKSAEQILQEIQEKKAMDSTQVPS